VPPAAVRFRSTTKRRTANNSSVRFKNATVKQSDEPAKKTAPAKPKKRTGKARVKARVTKVDDRPKLRTRPERREPPNPRPTPPRQKRDWGKPEIGPVNTADLLTSQELYMIACHFENLGNARTPNETALLKKLKRWKKQ
jgi:hypothetical protein